MMMALGLFVFSLSTASYQELSRSTSWRHPSNSRVGNSPAYQFIGAGEDTITLKGEIYHEITGNRITLDVLRSMADTGKAYILIEGTGKIYGLVIIDDFEETKSYFFKDGAARKTTFTVTLKIIKKLEPSKIGILSSVGIAALNRIM